MRLLSELQGVQVVDFVADIATDLPKYGLDQPTVKVTLSSYASENTAETKSGEKPIVSVLFGRVEGDNLFAKLDDEPFVVTVPKTLLDFILVDPIQWQELPIYQNRPEDITWVEIARQGQPTVTLERDKDKKWTLAKGDGQVNQVNAQSMVNTLATLRAVRWIGATTKEHTLEEPVIVATFKAGESSGKLLLGAPTPDFLSYASAEGKTGTFGVSQPDVTAFQLPLIEGAPAAAPAPMAAPATPAAPAAPPAPPAAPTTPPAAPPATPPRAPAATPLPTVPNSPPVSPVPAPTPTAPAPAAPAPPLPAN
jgi:hypothetical protein